MARTQFFGEVIVTTLDRSSLLLIFNYAPNNSTLLCQALSPKLLYEDWQRDYTFLKDLLEDLISALLHWSADAAIYDSCAVSGQRPFHMAAEHHNHRVVGSLIEAGAHLDAVNGIGDTGMDIAIKRDYPEILATIRSPILFAHAPNTR